MILGLYDSHVWYYCIEMSMATGPLSYYSRLLLTVFVYLIKLNWRIDRNQARCWFYRLAYTFGIYQCLHIVRLTPYLNDRKNISFGIKQKFHFNNRKLSVSNQYNLKSNSFANWALNKKMWMSLSQCVSCTLNEMTHINAQV